MYWGILVLAFSIGFGFVVDLAVVDPMGYADPTTVIVLITFFFVAVFTFFERER